MSVPKMTSKGVDKMSGFGSVVEDNDQSKG